jgi:hypothetical protein
LSRSVEMIRLLAILFVTWFSASCANLNNQSSRSEHLRVSLRRQGESTPTIVQVDGNRWTISVPDSQTDSGAIRNSPKFWRAVRQIELSRFDGFHVDPYCPDYRWEVRAVLDHASPIDGSGTHFGADGELFDDWNRLSSILDQAIGLDIDLRVDRTLYEKHAETILAPWERYGIAPQP